MYRHKPVHQHRRERDSNYFKLILTIQIYNFPFYKSSLLNYFLHLLKIHIKENTIKRRLGIQK